MPLDSISGSAATKFSMVPSFTVRRYLPGAVMPQFRPSSSFFGMQGYKVHGRCQLPLGYTLSMVPPVIDLSANLVTTEQNESMDAHQIMDGTARSSSKLCGILAQVQAAQKLQSFNSK